MHNTFPQNNQDRFAPAQQPNAYHNNKLPPNNNIKQMPNSMPEQHNNRQFARPISSSVSPTIKEKRIKLTAYGAKAAFQVEQSNTTDGRFTINIESANKSNPGSNDDLRYNWQEKITFQLTQLELPVFCATTLGINHMARFDLHGKDNSKFLEIINQGKSFFFKMGSKDRGLKVAPVSVVETYQFGMLALNEYTKNFPSLSTDSALMAIRLMTKQLCDNNLIKQPKSQ